MSDTYGLDSSKIMYHVDWVSKWVKDPSNAVPIYVELSPSNYCNHKCTFCAEDFAQHRKYSIEYGVLRRCIEDMGRLGVKGVMFGGEGEPFIHPHIVDLVRDSRSMGMEVAFTTNGTLYSEEISKGTLALCSWIKFSINAGSQEVYQRLHRCRPGDYQLVQKNIKAALKNKREGHLKTTLGSQAIALPENITGLLDLAEWSLDVGLDFFVIKPYSQHEASGTTAYRDFVLTTQDYEVLQYLEDRFKGFVIVRWDAFSSASLGRRVYAKCMATPYVWAYIDSEGNVWACSAMKGVDARFRLGNIHERGGFQDAWFHPKRDELIRSGFNIDKCRVNCRMDKVNRYLDGVVNGVQHMPFI